MTENALDVLKNSLTSNYTLYKLYNLIEDITKLIFNRKISLSIKLIISCKKIANMILVLIISNYSNKPKQFITLIKNNLIKLYVQLTYKRLIIKPGNNLITINSKKINTFLLYTKLQSKFLYNSNVVNKQTFYDSNNIIRIIKNNLNNYLIADYIHTDGYDYQLSYYYSSPNELYQCIDSLLNEEKTNIKTQYRIAKSGYYITDKRCSLETCNGNKEKYNIFETKEYKSIIQLLQKYISIKKSISHIRPPIFVINGIPGLGKTNLCDYIASKNIFTQIIKYNMLEFTSYSFDNIMNATTNYFDNINDKTELLFIDEIDKYLDIYISRNEANEKTIKKNIKKQFLSCLTNLINNTTIPIIFTSNNFNTIFTNDVHIKALKTRFISLNIYPYKYNNVINYIKFLNKNIKNTGYGLNKNELNKLLNNINKNIQITPRRLNHIFCESRYDIKKMLLNPILTQNKKESIHLN